MLCLTLLYSYKAQIVVPSNLNIESVEKTRKNVSANPPQLRLSKADHAGTQKPSPQAPMLVTISCWVMKPRKTYTYRLGLIGIVKVTPGVAGKRGREKHVIGSHMHDSKLGLIYDASRLGFCMFQSDKVINLAVVI